MVPPCQIGYTFGGILLSFLLYKQTMCLTHFLTRNLLENTETIYPIFITITFSVFLFLKKKKWLCDPFSSLFYYQSLHILCQFRSLCYVIGGHLPKLHQLERYFTTFETLGAVLPFWDCLVLSRVLSQALWFMLWFLH